LEFFPQRWISRRNGSAAPQAPARERSVQFGEHSVNFREHSRNSKTANPRIWSFVAACDLRTKRLGMIKGTLGVIQGILGVIQRTLGVIQGTFSNKKKVQTLREH
jgi:hypothetical protein